MAFRSISTNETAGATGTTSATVAVPAGVQDNDIIVIIAATDQVGATVDTIPSGFTQLYFETCTADGQAAWAGWKRAASESGNYTLILGSTGLGKSIMMHATAHSGRITSGSPLTSSTSAVQNTGQSSPVSVNATGLTAAQGDDLIWISVPDVTALSVGNGHTAPSGYTERSDQEGSLDAWVNLSVATLDNVSSGATGTVTGTLSLSSNTAGWRAYLIALAAASSGTVGPGARLSNMLNQPMLRGPY